MVVVLHTAGAGFYSFGRGWWASNFYDSLTRACVPLFLMISGALLIPRDEPYGLYVKKRVLRIIPPIIFWSIIYAFYWNLFNEGLVVLLKKLFTARIADVLWYLYILVGLYLFIPFLSKMYYALNDRAKKIFLALWFVCSILPTIQTLLGINTYLVGTYGLAPFVGLFGYMFAGAYIFERTGRPNAKPKMLSSVILFLGSCAFTAIATYWYSVRRDVPNELFYQYLAPGVLVSTLAAFQFFAGLTNSERLAKWIKPISDGSLGIYCLHLLLVINLLEWTGGMAVTISPWLMVPIRSIIVIVASTAIIYVFRKLMPLARYVT